MAIVYQINGKDLPKGDGDTPTLPPAGEPPDNGSMEARITALETRLDTVVPTLATKADLAELRTEVHKGFADNLKWMVGAMLGLAVLSLSILTFVVNNVAQKAAASATPPTQPPIIINVPSTAQAPSVPASGPK